ncbi:MAG: hypothetical protein RLZZ546_2188, partial [Bacteroidota bacterium]
EAQAKYKKALHSLAKMNKCSCNNINKNWIEETEQRIVKKKEGKKKKESKKIKEGKKNK